MWRTGSLAALEHKKHEAHFQEGSPAYTDNHPLYLGPVIPGKHPTSSGLAGYRSQSRLPTARALSPFHRVQASSSRPWRRLWRPQWALPSPLTEEPASKHFLSVSRCLAFRWFKRDMASAPKKREAVRVTLVMGVAWEQCPLWLWLQSLSLSFLFLLSLLSCPAHAGLRPLFSFPVASGPLLGLGGE